MVEFVVAVPADTPDWEPVFLAGDGDALGRWRADAVRLDRWDDGTHRARVDLPAGGPVRFLVTRGRWRVAESDGHGRERPAREVPAGASVVEARVDGWGRNSVRYHHDFRSAALPAHPRTVTVHLPPGYDLDPDRRFPVLYLHDGQNLFDPETAFAGNPWRADEAAEQAVRGGTAGPVILVGVANTPDRLREYGPHTRPEEAADDLSAEYGKLLVDEVKPVVDREYRALPGPDHTGVAGSSMGGLISLHLWRRYPDVFGRCGALSPSLWWDGEAILRDPAVDPVGWPAGGRVWVDVGGREGGDPEAWERNVVRARRLSALLGRRRAGGPAVRFVEDTPAGHDEAAWGARFGPMLGFLFPPGQ